MDTAGILVSILVLLPLLTGGLCLVARTTAARDALVFVTTIAIAAASLVMLSRGGVELTPQGSWDRVIAIADFALLGYFAWLGVQRRNLLAVALALAQLGPLAWLELVSGARLEAVPAFVADWLAVTMVLIVCIVGSIVVVYAIPYMREHEHHLRLEVSRQPRFFFYLLVFLGAMNGLLLANNLVWLYFFWEITTLCCVMLIAHDGTAEAMASSTRALVMNLVGGVAFAAAIVTLSTQAHTVSLRDITAGGTASDLLFLPLALLCLAGFTKAAQMPFQSWLLGAMVAPTPVSALLHSSTMVKAGVYLLLRLSPALHGTQISAVVAAVGAFTFVAAAMIAISQGNVKRVLAYSTISNLGLIIACIGLNTAMSVSAALMLTVFHAVSKALLFMAAGVIEQGIASRRIEDMEGLIVRMPVTAHLTLLGILSMLLPPFGMLVAKWAAIEAAAHHPLTLVLFVAGGAFTVVFWTKWIGRLVTVAPASEHLRAESLHPLLVVTMGSMGLAAIGLSFGIGPLLEDLIVPSVAAYHQGLGFSVHTLTLGSSVGDFPIGLVAAWMAAALVVPLLVLRAWPLRRAPAYMCGENADASTFRSVGDAPEAISIGGYYFTRYFGERRNTPWVNAVAITLLVVLFGVATGF